MRTIKFRGMTTQLVTNHFVYGNYQRLIGYGPYDSGEVHHYIIDDHDNYDSIDPETLGQYTGLLDKNGVEIFEGDVISYTAGEYSQGYHQYSGCFIVDDIRDMGEIANADVLEITGNIHEVPNV